MSDRITLQVQTVAAALLEQTAIPVIAAHKILRRQTSKRVVVYTGRWT